MPCSTRGSVSFQAAPWRGDQHPNRTGKLLIITFLAVGEPHPDDTRTLFFELNGQPREVRIRDRSVQAVARPYPKADPAEHGQIGAPTSGVVTGVFVKANQTIVQGEKPLVLDAMKMQSSVYAAIAGRIGQVLVSPGQHVQAKDLLLTILR
jgi:pyruvate carboxylase